MMAPAGWQDMPEEEVLKSLERVYGDRETAEAALFVLKNGDGSPKSEPNKTFRGLTHDRRPTI